MTTTPEAVDKRRAKLAVGQTLWCVPYGTRDPYEVRVAKVGRRWATIESSEHRVDINTLETEAYGYFYLSESDWRAEQAIKRHGELWKCLCQDLRWFSPNQDVPEADIREAARLLRIDLPLQEAAE